VGIAQKVVIITGALQGIGAALVEAYRDRDYGVVATARSIRPTNDDQILVVPGDITDRKTAERAISEGLARFGRIDTLINNAGVFVAKVRDYSNAIDVDLVVRCALICLIAPEWLWSGVSDRRPDWLSRCRDLPMEGFQRGDIDPRCERWSAIEGRDGWSETTWLAEPGQAGPLGPG
jgi:NAD(P)-dependent dehydrogenase (short-subunit alcohol dehydrogenase family)